MRRAILALMATLVVSQTALAQESGDPALAEQLFREGKELLDQKRYPEACPKLAESQRQDPGSGTLFALGLCYEAWGKTASAWSTFNEATSAARQAGRTDREQAATEHATALEPKLSRLTVNVTTTPSLSVTRDGQLLNSAAWGSAVPVDPGEHVVEAIAPGKVRFRKIVTVRENADRQVVVVPLLDDAPPTPVTTPLPIVPISNTNTNPNTSIITPVETATTNPTRTAGFVVGSAGLLGLAIGGVVGISAITKNSDAKGLCPTTPCSNQDGVTKNHDAQALADWSTGTMIGSGVVLVIGLVMVLVGKPSSHVVPVASKDGGGLMVHGAF